MKTTAGLLLAAALVSHENFASTAEGVKVPTYHADHPATCETPRIGRPKAKRAKAKAAKASRKRNR